jgi:uncharacterized membrane protein
MFFKIVFFKKNYKQKKLHNCLYFLFGSIGAHMDPFEKIEILISVIFKIMFFKSLLFNITKVFGKIY